MDAIPRGRVHPPVELDDKIHHIDTASSTQVVGSNNLQHPWCHKLLNPTTCLGMQVVGSNNLWHQGCCKLLDPTIWVLEADYFIIQFDRWRDHPPVEVDGKIYHIDTASSTQAVGSNNLQHSWCHKLLDPTTCIPKQVVGFDLEVFTMS